MDSILSRLILYSLLLMLVFAPFAGFAPLMLIILIAGTYWILSPIAKILIFGKEEISDSDIAENKG